MRKSGASPLPPLQPNPLPPPPHLPLSPPPPPSVASDTSLGRLSPPPPAPYVESPWSDGYGDLRLGTVLADRYRIEEEVGQGGMGVVYRAVDLELDEAVAIKLFGQRKDDPNLVSRFKQELSICRSL